MGFWSSLGKGLLGAGGLIAAPFTGGASAAILPAVLGGAGAVVGAMGDAAAQNRGEQDRMNLTRDQIGLQAANSFETAQQNRARLEMDQREEQRAAEKAAYLNALKSALAMNMQDAKFDRSGFRSPVANISFSGGVRPSAIGAQGHDAAAALNNSALRQLMSPEPMMELAPIERFQQSEPSKASFWEKLAGPVGMGLTLAGKATGAKTPVGSDLPQGLDPQNFHGTTPFSNVRF